MIPTIALLLPLFPDRASTIAGRVDALFFFLIAVSLFFSILIVGVIFYFFVKYRRRSEDEIPDPIEGSIRLEATWIVIPFILAMVIFVWGASVFFAINRVPRDTLDIYVVGKQWMWKFQHPEGHREINQLHVPVDTSIKLTMATEDVIHSLYIPEFRVKHDVVPGRYTTLWFRATKPGRYYLFCAEYCGTQHSGMIGSIVVLEPAAYQAWLSGGAPEGSLAAAGEKVFQDLACVQCHRGDSMGRGPVLEGVFGSQVTLQGGQTVIADEAYLRESILEPRAKIVMGYDPIMPTFRGQVSEEQILQLIAYIKSLVPPEQGPAGTVPAAKPGAGTLPNMNMQDRIRGAERSDSHSNQQGNRER